MPVIQDPRQNPHKERKFGIMEFNGIYVYYDKEKLKEKRALPHGFEIDESDITLHFERSPVIWKGQVITIEAKFSKDAIERSLGNQGDVTKKIYEKMKDEFTDTWPPNSEYY